jgi:hypothetical protein
MEYYKVTKDFVKSKDSAAKKQVFEDIIMEVSFVCTCKE